jgi:hypothetical protein
MNGTPRPLKGHGRIQTPLKPYFAGPGQPFWQVSQYLGRKSLAGHYLD